MSRRNINGHLFPAIRYNLRCAAVFTSIRATLSGGNSIEQDCGVENIF